MKHHIKRKKNILKIKISETCCLCQRSWHGRGRRCAGCLVLLVFTFFSNLMCLHNLISQCLAIISISPTTFKIYQSISVATIYHPPPLSLRLALLNDRLCSGSWVECTSQWSSSTTRWFSRCRFQNHVSVAVIVSCVFTKHLTFLISDFSFLSPGDVWGEQQPAKERGGGGLGTKVSQDIIIVHFLGTKVSQNIITIFWDLEPRLVKEVIIVITISWDTVSMGKVWNRK